jgi:hypothetical protein
MKTLCLFNQSTRFARPKSIKGAAGQTNKNAEAIQSVPWIERETFGVRHWRGLLKRNQTP